MRVLLIPICLAAFPPDQDKKRPVPDAAALREAEKLIRDVFKQEFSKKDPADRLALAKKLIQQASETRDDPVTRYVLLREASDLSAQAGQPRAALEAIDQIAKGFDVDKIGMKQTTLAAAAKAARTSDDQKALASTYLELVEDAVALDDYDSARKAAVSAGELARKAKDPALTTRAEAVGKELSDVMGQYAAFKKARETLAASPEDPAANLIAGRFHCLVKGRWDTGLPLLYRGSNAALSDLAGKDLANPGDFRDQLLLADGWWDLGEKESGKAREHVRSRAAHWYEIGLLKATGLTKSKAEKRLEELRRARPAEKRIDLLRLINPEQDTVKGTWAHQGGVLTMTPSGICMIPYVPPDEYDMKLVVERVEGIENLWVGFIMSGRQSGFSIDGGKAGDFSGISLLDGLRSMDNESRVNGTFIALNKPALIVCSVRRTGVALSINGKTIIDWKGDAGRLSVNPAINVVKGDLPFIGGLGKFQFSEITLIPLSGEGRRAR